MSPTTTPTPIWEEEEQPAPSLSLPPERVLVQVPLAQVAIPVTPELSRRARLLLPSIRARGVLLPPGLFPAGIDLPTGQVRYGLIWGRARALAARLAEQDELEGFLYPARPTPAELALWAQDEQTRSDDFAPLIGRISALLHDERHPRSESELVKELGVPRSQLATPLALAQLPPALVAAITAGQCSQALARKIVRLSQGRQQELADLVDTGGTPLSEDLVEGLWKGQATRVQQAAQLLPEQDVPAQNSRSGAKTSTPDGTRLTRAELVDLAGVLAIVQQEVNTRLVPVFTLVIQEVNRLAKERGREE